MNKAEIYQAVRKARIRSNYMNRDLSQSNIGNAQQQAKYSPYFQELSARPGNDYTIDVESSSPKNKTRNHKKSNSIQINMDGSKNKMKILTKKNSSILYAHATKNKHSIKIEGVTSPHRGSGASGERKGFSGFNEQKLYLSKLFLLFISFIFYCRKRT